MGVGPSGLSKKKVPGVDSDCLQRELPDSRSESLDNSQERKWVQPANKGHHPSMGRVSSTPILVAQVRMRTQFRAGSKSRRKSQAGRNPQQSQPPAG